MKKLIIFLVSLMTFGSVAMADTVGYLEVDKILITYKAAKKFQEDFKKKQEDYEKFVSKKQKEIEKAEEKGKSKEEIKKLLETMETEIRPKQEEILAFRSQFEQQLITEVMSTAKVVAKEYGIDVVLDKRAVYSGGFDLTDFIIDRLNRN